MGDGVNLSEEKKREMVAREEARLGRLMLSDENDLPATVEGATPPAGSAEEMSKSSEEKELARLNKRYRGHAEAFFRCFCTSGMSVYATVVYFKMIFIDLFF